MTKSFLSALIVFLLLVPYSRVNAAENQKETYHILQKGYIEVDGSTTLFDFSGKSVKQSGKLKQNESGLYTGQVVLRFDQLVFHLPGVDSILEDPKYLDIKSYPTVEIDLSQFDPHQKPPFVEGFLTLHNVRKKIRIQVDLIDISPLVAAKGRFSIIQSDFHVRPYQSGFLKINDNLDISFQLYFCEVHTQMPKDHNLHDPLLLKIQKEAGITILSEPNFYGCQELKLQLQAE